MRRSIWVLAGAMALGAACSGVGPLGPGGNGLTLSPSNPILTAIGATTRLDLVIGDGMNLSGDEVTWRSSVPSVASVSADGVVTAMGDGSTTITADLGGPTASTTVTVQATIQNTARISAMDQTDGDQADNVATVSVLVSVN